MYHGVFKAGTPVAPYGIGARQLEQQLRLLQQWQFQAVTFGQLLQIVLQKAPGPKKMVVLTFDDGDTTFAETTLPLLHQLGMTATIFVINGRFGQPGFMDVATVKEAMNTGIEVGVHGLNHRSVCRCSEAELYEEIVVAKQRLEASLATRLPTFCYPYGHHHPRLYPRLAQAGYLGAAAVFSREPTVTHNPYAMRRIYPHPGDGPFRFRLKLSPLYLKWVAYRDRHRQTEC
jgi:peptidoglycan/xylan/chitin deacetylase (PgdA/CDA1 family)